jgi:septum formation protein
MAAQHQMTTFVLASASPARATVLRNAGIDPHIVVSNVDEDALLAQLADVSFADQVLALAQAKCESVAPQFASDGDTLVLGCDSMFELDGQLFGKPRDPAQAMQRLQHMSGRTGTLLTGHWLAAPHSEVAVGGVASTDVTIAELEHSDIEAYIATGEPLHVAGSFTLDGLGGAFVEAVNGDPSNVIGVSLPLVRILVGELGFSWPNLWTHPDR